MPLWEDDDEQFRDVPDEAGLDENGHPGQSQPVNPRIQQSAPAPRPQAPAQEQEVTRFEGDIDLEIPEFDEEDFTAVLNDANLRIEQGRLYQMIMNHDLFDGMEADPRAVQNVQREIRKFARESMEVMLGMRETTPVHATVASPFNDLEVEVLKKIASSASKGATESPEANEKAAVLKQAPKRTSINTIGGSTALKRSTAPTPKPQQRLATKPAAPVQRKAQTPQHVEQILAEEGVTKEQLDAQYGNYKPLDKHITELSPEEQQRRIKEVNARLASKKTVRSSNALPMASPEQMELLAMQRASQVSGGPGMSQILEAVKKMPITIKTT